MTKADVQLITRLVRLTFEAQLPPTLLSIAYVAEWSVTPSSLLGALFQVSFLGLKQLQLNM